MAVKRNDAQAQQALDHKKAASKLALRVLTASETHSVAAAAAFQDGLLKIVQTVTLNN